MYLRVSNKHASYAGALVRFLLVAVIVLGTAGCGDQEPPAPSAPAVEAPRPGPASYVFGGRYQGVASNNQFAVWVVDTQTGAVVRCDTQACGEWVMPKVPGSTPMSDAPPAGPLDMPVPIPGSQR